MLRPKAQGCKGKGVQVVRGTGYGRRTADTIHLSSPTRRIHIYCERAGAHSSNGRPHWERPPPAGPPGLPKIRRYFVHWLPAMRCSPRQALQSIKLRVFSIGYHAMQPATCSSKHKIVGASAFPPVCLVLAAGQPDGPQVADDWSPRCMAALRGSGCAGKRAAGAGDLVSGR